MTALFLKIVNTGISAGWVVLAVLAVRLVLRKAPKWTHVLLWGIVALRLIFPFSLESALSLIPSAQTLPDQLLAGPSFQIHTGVPPVDQRVNEYLGDRYFEGVSVPTGSGRDTMTLFAVLWIVGTLLLLAYMAVSYLRLWLRLSEAVPVEENVFRSRKIEVPFVFGFLKPEIYLPWGMDSETSAYVVRHERAHIRRGDHWWKMIGFLILAVYWFHPLLWAAYLLFCRDIELACDEKVIRELPEEQRADYSQALLDCSIGRDKGTASGIIFPPSFGEQDVKKRIRHILYYRKPVFWATAGAVAGCAVLAVCFLTDSPSEESGMVPTTADLHGIWNGYLFLPINGETYRYEQTDADPEMAVQGELLDSFTEQTGTKTVSWEIYSVQESPDRLVVLAKAEADREVLSGNSVVTATEESQNRYLYRYSPAKRSEPDALQKAKDDGCAVMEDGYASFGQEIWQTFVETAEKGQKASVQVAHYYTLDEEGSSREYYQSVKEDYPILYRFHLEFDGETYTLRWIEEETEYVRTYRYLMHYRGDGSDAEEREFEERYVLTNDNTVTWEDIVNGMLSSQSGDAIDHYSIYTVMERG